MTCTIDEFFASSQCPSREIRVPSQIFCGAVHNSIDSMFQWLLQGRCGKRVVDDRNNSSLPRSFGGLLQVDKAVNGVGGRLKPEYSRTLPHNLWQLAYLLSVNKACLHYTATENLRHELHRAAID